MLLRYRIGNFFNSNDFVQSLSRQIPVIILEGSELANEVFACTEGKGEPKGNATRKKALTALAKSHYIKCKESSEDLASIAHLMLAVTLF